MTTNPMPQQDQLELRDRVLAVAEEAARARGLYVVDVQLRGQQGSRVVEVFADAEQGVGLDDLAELSRDIDFVLEAEDVIKGRYYLNVSSPGAERPFTDPRQFRRHLGRTIEVDVVEGGESKTVTGVLGSVHEEGVSLDGRDGAPTELRFENIREARVQLPW